jgi:tRNA-dihydrouridine synthase
MEDKRIFLMDYFQVMLAEQPNERRAIGKVKQLCAQFTHGLPGGAIFREQVFHSQSVSELTDRINNYFSQLKHFTAQVP